MFPISLIQTFLSFLFPLILLPHPFPLPAYYAYSFTRDVSRQLGAWGSIGAWGTGGFWVPMSPLAATVAAVIFPHPLTTKSVAASAAQSPHLSSASLSLHSQLHYSSLYFYSPIAILSTCHNSVFSCGVSDVISSIAIGLQLEPLVFKIWWQYLNLPVGSLCAATLHRFVSVDHGQCWRCQGLCESWKVCGTQCGHTVVWDIWGGL